MSCHWNIVRDSVDHIPIGVTRSQRVLHVDQAVRYAEDAHAAVSLADPVTHDRHIAGNTELNFIVAKYATISDLVGQVELGGT